MLLRGKFAVGAMGVLSACAAVAMPTREEFKKVLPLVREISADDVAAVKAGKMTPLEAGNNAFERAKDQTIDEASRYLFHESAFSHYVRAGEYDKAASVVESLKATVKDVPDSAVAELIERRLKNVPRKHAGQLYALLRDARVRDTIAKKLAGYAKAAAKSSDADLWIRVGAAQVLLDNWEEALKAFANCKGEMGKVAAAEKDAKAMTADKIADFWWKFQVQDIEFSNYSDSLEDAFRAHAAMWYRQALDSGALKGVKRQLVEKRIEGIEPTKSAVAVASSQPTAQAAVPQKDIVLEISPGVKMEFVFCPAGTFTMGHRGDTDPESPYFEHQVTISRPFWMSKYPVTVGDVTAVCGKLDREQNAMQMAVGPKMPYFVTKSDGYAKIFDFMRRVAKRAGGSLPSGQTLRFPTEAEYEYAASAGGKVEIYTGKKYVWGNPQNGFWWKDLKAFLEKKGISTDGGGRPASPIHFYGPSIYSGEGAVMGPVGERGVNGWGLGDVYAGSVVLDRCLGDASSFKGVYSPTAKDPLCTAGDAQMVLFMGVKNWGYVTPFRLVIGPDLIKERGLQALYEKFFGEKVETVMGTAAPTPVGTTAQALSEPTFGGRAQKSLKFELGRGVEIEFLECPAGSFMMGTPGVTDNRRGDFYHKVNFTRPFFMSKSQVSLRQYMALCEKDLPKPVSEIDKLLDMNVAMKCDPSNIDQFVTRFSKRNRSRFPKNYVLRVPTEAEYEYSRREWAGDSNQVLSADGICKILQDKGLDLAAWSLRKHGNKVQLTRQGSGSRIDCYGPLGAFAANKWGFSDFYGHNFMLDRLGRSWFGDPFAGLCNATRLKEPDTYHDKGMQYAAEETDPIRYEKNSDLIFAFGNTFRDKYIWMKSQNQMSFRLVIGPDLIAEKGQKK